ncbi:MAG TPA: hypothetical protein VFU31_24640 [Candidatus Binatia bacterium]|nr:hypothetical protein [Candidatus Binatia bacterium]
MNKKLSAGAIGVPLAVVIAWAFQAFSGVVVPAEVAAAFGAVCTFTASVLIPDSKEA